MRVIVLRLNAGLRAAAAWVGWPLTIIVLGAAGTIIGISDFIVYLLTVQTAISASVADITQKHSQDEDAKRDARNDAVLMELQRQAHAAVKRDKMIIATLKAQNDLLDFITEGGFKRNESSKVKRRTRTDRKGDGHRNRPKP